MTAVYVVGIVFGTLFFVVAFDLMRRRLLLEQYAILWLCMGAVILLLSIFHAVLSDAARALGIFYAPSLLFLVGLVFMLGVIVHLTIAISRLTLRSTRLIQEVALLRTELEEWRAQVREGGAVHVDAAKQDARSHTQSIS